MKQVKLRSMLVLALIAVLGAGVVLFCVRYVVRGGQWAAFSANDHAYRDGRLALGQVLDRNGVLLYDGASGSWAEDGVIRRATLHVVGDRDDNISTSAKAAMRRRLVGFDPLTGTSAGGHKVYLTIDAELNAAALEALNGRKGAVAVYNYRTGDVLCMVSSPTFDPADPPEIRDGDSRYDGVYLNRVLSSTFAPGSVFKLVTTAAALENLDGALDRHFTCTGRLELDGGVITCPYAHGDMDLYDALARSCNCAYAQMAVELGGETLARYAEKAGLTESFTVSGISAAAGQFTVGQGANLGWSGVGQYDDLVNPCAFLRFLGSITGGRSAGPRLVYKETTMHGIPLPGGGAPSLKAPFDADTCRVLRDMMRNNVQQTYGQSMFGSLAVCAKSGTAEAAPGQSPHAWFAGFVADEDLPLAFVVLVETAAAARMPPGPLPPGCWHRRQDERTPLEDVCPPGGIFLFSRGIQGRQQPGVDALRVLPEPVRQIPGHGLGGGGELQVQDTVHIVLQAQLHQIGAVFLGGHPTLDLVFPQQEAVVFRHILIRPQPHGVGETGLADLAVFQPLGSDGIAAVLRQAQMLRPYQVVQALGIGKVVDAVVTHGQLLHALRRQGLRYPGGNI